MTARGPIDSPLAGLRVIELSHILAAPTCGLMLADLGAEVIKVERPPGGDSQRWDTAAEDRLAQGTSSFLQVNRGKRSLCLDLKSAAGQEVLWRLLEGADILLENYRPGVLARLGFDTENLRARCPRLIVCAITGFGLTGPLAKQGGFDLMAQAMSGLMSVTGADGDGTPVKCGPPLTDIAAGLLAAIGILAALERRHRAGRGEVLDTSLFEAGIMMTYWQSAVAFASGSTPQAMGTAHPLYAPYQAFATEDGWITLGTATERAWRRLLNLLDVTELADDPRFADGAARLANRHALAALLGKRFATRPSAYWLAALAGAGIPAGPLLTVNQMHELPQTLARDMVLQVPNGAAGPAQAIGCPIKWQDAATPPKKGAPRLGADGPAILQDLGYRPNEIAAMIDTNVIAVDGGIPEKERGSE